MKKLIPLLFLLFSIGCIDEPGLQTYLEMEAPSFQQELTELHETNKVHDEAELRIQKLTEPQMYIRLPVNRRRFRGVPSEDRILNRLPDRRRNRSGFYY